MSCTLLSLGRSGLRFGLLFCILALACSSATNATKPPAVAKSAHAMVVCAHPLAARIGSDVLRRGGNAVDAAVAVQFALSVVYPNAGNLGGGGFLVWRSRKGEALCLDFREKAPHAASANMYLDSNQQVITGLSLEGSLASGVPGSVDGMVQAHKRLGSRPWKELVQPAIDLARKGFAITQMQASELNEYLDDFRRWNDRTCPLIHKHLWRAGEILRQPDLSRTLERIRDKGRDGFYSGQTAQNIVATLKQHQSHSTALIDSVDLADYHAVWRIPLRGTYRDVSLICMPPPSSGGVALLQLLSMWESRSSPLLPFHSAAAVHTIAECERRVYADRSEWLGDPDFVKVPVQALLKPDYLRERMSDFDALHATPSSSIEAGKLSPAESEQTTHFSIVDTEGNAVALTTTLNDSYGSKVMVTGAGFLLNNEMDDFSVKAGVPNYYGLIGTQRNAIAPGKRMLSSMTPTIVEKNGSLFMVVGTPGGATIITSVFQCIINVIDYHMSIQQAVNAPRFHHQWRPDQIFMEQAMVSDELSNALASKGHSISIRRAMGRVDAIVRQPDGSVESGADPRGDDCAAGF